MAGLLIAIALGIHNVPEGLAMTQLFVDAGQTPVRAVLRTMLVVLPQTVAALATFGIVTYAPALFPGFCGCL